MVQVAQENRLYCMLELSAESLQRLLAKRNSAWNEVLLDSEVNLLKIWAPQNNQNKDIPSVHRIPLFYLYPNKWDRCLVSLLSLRIPWVKALGPVCLAKFLQRIFTVKSFWHQVHKILRIVCLVGSCDRILNSKAYFSIVKFQEF